MCLVWVVQVEETGGKQLEAAGCLYILFHMLHSVVANKPPNCACANSSFGVVLFYTGSVMCNCSSGPHLSLNIAKPFICRPALKINLGCPWFLSFKFPEEGRSFSCRPTYNWTSFCNQFSHALLAIRQKFKLKALLPWLNFSDTEGMSILYTHVSKTVVSRFFVFRKKSCLRATKIH